MVLGVRTTYPEISPSPKFSCLCELGIHSFKLDEGTLSLVCQETIGIFPLMYGAKQQAGSALWTEQLARAEDRGGVRPEPPQMEEPRSAISLQRPELAGIKLCWCQLWDRLSTLEWFWALVTRHSRETESSANLGMQLPCILIWRFSSLCLQKSWIILCNTSLHLHKDAGWTQQAGGLKHFWLQRRD